MIQPNSQTIDGIPLIGKQVAQLIKQTGSFLPAMGWLINVKNRPFTEGLPVQLETLFSTKFIPKSVLKCARQVGKTTSKAAKIAIVAASIPYFQTLVITPQFEMTRRFSNNYIRPLIEQSPISAIMLDTVCENNVLQRTFVNQSSIICTFALLDAERARGIAGDFCAFDETQNIDFNLIQEIVHTMDRSHWRIEDYSGTPKTLDNPMETFWLQSSQAEWLIPCACGYTNNPQVEADGLKMIGDKTIVCARCKNPVNPNGGYWYHNKPEKMNDFTGWHIPQFIMPFHYNDARNWKIIVEAKNGSIPKRMFYNEMLGESCDIGAKLITETELRTACTLPITMEYNTARKLILSYGFISLGIDWGGRGEDELSRTKAAITGMRPDGRCDLLYAEDMSNLTDPGQEVARAVQLFNDFNCKILAHDAAGTAGMRDVLLNHARFPRRQIMPMSYVSAWSKDVIFYHEANDRIKWPHYSLDKTRSLLLTIECIKHGFVFFPLWESMERFLRDFLALVEEKSDSRRGSDVYLIRRAKGQCDDFTHALNFALLATYHSNNKFPDLVNTLPSFADAYLSTLEEMNKERAMEDWIKS
jgi:hypothetical protein